MIICSVVAKSSGEETGVPIGIELDDSDLPCSWVDRTKAVEAGTVGRSDEADVLTPSLGIRRTSLDSGSSALMEATQA